MKDHTTLLRMPVDRQQNRKVTLRQVGGNQRLKSFVTTREVIPRLRAVTLQEPFELGQA